MYIFKRNLITIIGKTKQRQFFKRITGSLLSVVLLCSNFFVVPYSVPEIEALYCGLEEHAHTEQCYDEKLALVCGLEEHTHTEECYTESENSLKGWLKDLFSPSGASVETERSGGTSFTVYYPVPSSWIGSGKVVYMNVKRQSKGNWVQVAMTDTGKTYTVGNTSCKVYTATAEAADNYDNVKTIQFQLYVNGSYNTQVVAFSDTTTKLTAIDGKIYVSGSFVDYDPNVNADDTWDEDYIYLDMSSFTGWLDAEAKFAIYYKKKDGTWAYSAEFVQIADTEVYKLARPTDMNNYLVSSQFSLFRFMPTATITAGSTWNNDNNDKFYAKKENLSLSANNNRYTINNWGDINGTSNIGYWNGLYTPPAEPSGDGTYQKIYFDATLSKLPISANEISSISDYTYRSIPNSVSGDGNVYYRIRYTDYTFRYGTMTKENNVTQSGHTWSNVYSVTADANKEIDKIQFGSFSLSRFFGSPEDGKCTQMMSIPSGYTNPCFYADASDKSIYEDGWREGYWQEKNTLYDAEQYKSSDIVDIASKTFTRDDDKLYLSTTLYDYYSDYEINGNNRDDYGTSKGSSHRNWVIYRQFDQALSDRYRSSSANYPLYVGQFQPSISGWGYDFTEIGDTLNLYGYSGDTTSDAYKKFISINNSVLDIDGNRISEDGGTTYKFDYTFRSLVGDIGADINYVASMPLFDADFLRGNNSKNAVIGDVYQNVKFPFTKQDINSDGVEYWIFDSNETHLVLNKDNTTNEYFLNSVNQSGEYKNLNYASEEQTKYGFFPFNETATKTTASTYNYGFGARLDLKFRLTSDGTVKNNQQENVPIEFTFSGDDDVWVFIDNKLVLDVGGAHSPSTGTINFKDLTATVSRVKKGGTSNSNQSNVTNSFTLTGDRTDEHTLTMFYMERGMWESNMKLTFNFPTENILEVEKEVDDSNVNSMFEGMFDDRKLFNFDIKTVATHYGKQAASGSTASKINVPLTDDNGTTVKLTKANAVTVFANEIESGLSQVGNDPTKVIRWGTNTSGNDDNRDSHYGQIELTNPILLSGQQYLQFDFLLNWSEDPGLRYLFVDLLDENSNTLLTRNNMSASDCIVGSPTMTHNTWIPIKLDLSKILAGGSSTAKVKYIRIGYDHVRNVYIKNMAFLPTTSASASSVGFTTAQNAIPDYNTSQDGVLKSPENAVYTSTVNGTKKGAYKIGSDGVFTLENNEKITFLDQFRLGSYMYISEHTNPLFDTKWTMYEDGDAVTAFGTGDSITNPATIPSMVNVQTATVIDGRTENVPNDNSMLNDGYPTATRSGYDNTFVFRSYSAPDKSGESTRLKVLFTNTIKTGTLKITKKQATGSNSLGAESFSFKVRFYNVGGLHLEGSNTVVEEFSLAAGGEKVFTGIPLNTQYDIYEIKSSNSLISLDHVEKNSSAVSHSSTTYGSQDAYLYSGKITTANSTDIVDFYNKNKVVTSLELTKAWVENGQTLADSQTPNSIRVQLQKSNDNGSTWSTVTGCEDVTVSHGSTAWTSFTYKFEGLDKYYSGTSEYLYRVIELDSSGNPVAANGTLTLNGNTYTVGTYTATKDSAKFTQTITNTLNPVVKITVEKKWFNANGAFVPVDSRTVNVQLQRSTNGATWTPVTDNSYNNVSLSNGSSWNYTFENLPKYIGSTAYQYRVVELNGNTVLNTNDTITVSGTSYKVTYGSLESTGINVYKQTINNTEDSKIKIKITKQWKNSDNDTLSTTPASVSVQIKRRAGSGEWETVGSAQTLDSSNSWTYTSGDLDKKNGSNVEYTYDVVEVGESSGTITIGTTNYTVTYAYKTDSTNSNQTNWTITNKVVPTVTLAVTKLSASDNTPLNGVKFTLEKQNGSTWSNALSTDDIITVVNGSTTASNLLPGTYRLTEIKTAEGYSLLSNPISIVIANNSGTYTATVDGTANTMTKTGDVYTLSLTIYNKQKLLMPATGGVNGFEFWIMGGLCVIAVPLLLYAFAVFKKGGRKASK